MKRILVFGDAHIPSRRNSIPASFYSHIEGADYDLALITGDLVRENEMRSALPTLPVCHIVQGNMDYGTGFDFHKQVQIDGFNILLIHGTQLRPRGNIKQLGEIVMNLDADIGIHGHTHTPAIDLHDGRLLLNPGTISGATGGWAGRVDASFMELEISGTQMTVVLHLTDWQVAKQSSLRFVKENEEIVRG